MSEVIDLLVRAKMEAGGVTAGVSQIQKALKGLTLPKGISDDIEKSFSKLTPLLKDYQKQLNKGFSNKKDIQNFTALRGQIDEVFSDIQSKIQQVNSKEIKLKVDSKALDVLQKNISSKTKDLQSALDKMFNKTFNTANVNQGFEKMFASSARATTLKPMLKSAMDLFGKQQFTAYNTELDKIKAKIMSLSSTKFKLAEQLGVKNAKNDMVAAEAAIDKFFNKLRANEGKAKGIDHLRQEIKELTQEASQLKLDSVAKGANELAKAGSGLGTLQKNLQGVGESANRAALGMMSAQEQIGHLRTTTQYFFGLSNMFNLLRRGIDTAVQSVKDLDKAMTETAVVTDYSVADMWGMLPEYTKLANKLGATTQGAYETMTLYFQQGLDKKATFEIGEETMKMARIAGLDYADTTNMMTAALRGFNMELNKTSAQKVNDVYSKLAAITASDTRELGLAMERTASIAHSAGMDFGNTTAFLAQMIETTREAPENLGTAMKTIVARFQELKENPYSISEVEGEEVNFNRVDKALKSIGVELMDNRDKFRDLDDVFMDISARWDGLSQTQQRYVATIAAGARQQSRFLAMVQNYGRLKELTTAAANSEGASQVQFNKTLESFESKVNKMKNAWQQFTMGIANNVFIKKATDGLTKILTLTNKLINSLSGGNGIIKSVLSLGTAFMGLKVGGRIVNSLIGGLSGFVDPRIGVMQGLRQGFSGNKYNNGMAQAKATADPIVAAINRAVGIITKDDQSSNTNKISDFKQQYKQAQKDLSNMGISAAFNPRQMSDVLSQFDDTKIQASLFARNKGHRQALSRSFTNMMQNLNVSDGAKAVGQNFYKELEKRMSKGKIDVSQGLATAFNPKALGREVGGDFEKEINKTINDNRKKLLRESRKNKDLKTKQDRYNWVRKQEQSQLGGLIATKLNDKEIQANNSKLMKAADVANRTGAAFTQLGLTLNNLGFEGLGNAFMGVGNGLMSIGMTAGVAEDAVSGLGKALRFIAANPMVAIATAVSAAAIAIGVASKIITKRVRKTGKEVVDNYQKTLDKTSQQINKFKKYQENWGTWSQGVDENGYNIGLSSSDYEDYLKAVKDITRTHPELIKGYNSLGNAIIDNNTALQKSIILSEKEQKEAEKTYLSKGNQIVERQKTYKRWQATQPITGNIYTKAAGYTAPSKIQDEANQVVKAIQKLDGGKDLLNQFGVKLNEIGNVTDSGIEALRTRGNDLLMAASNLYDVDEESLTKAQNKMAAFGTTIKGLEEATKDYYDWGWTYASKKGYDKMESNLLVPFQTGIQRLSEKGLSAGKFENEIDALAKKYLDLGGHAADFADIQEKVRTAQKDFGKDGNIDTYIDKVKQSTKGLDEWIKNLEETGDEADKLLAEFFNSYKNTALDINESIPSFEESVNTWAGDISAANKAYDNWNKAIEGGDYYTAREGFKKMYEEVNDGIDDIGNKSQSWWKAARSIMGDDFILKNSSEQIKSHMDEVGKYFDEGRNGIDNFFTDVKSKIENDNSFKDLTKDLITINEKGGLDFNFDNVSDEKFKQIADALGLSEDAMVALFNAARQFTNLTFDNVEDMKSALVAEGTTLGTSGKVYFSQDDFLLRAMEANGGDKSAAEKSLQQFIDAGNIALKKDKETGKMAITKKDLSGFIKDWDIRKETKNGLNYTDSISLISKLGNANLNKEEVKDVYDSNKDLIKDYDPNQFESFWQQYLSQENPVLQPVQSIQGTAEGILSAVNALQLQQTGILTESARGEINKGINRAEDFASSFSSYKSYEDYDSERRRIQADLEESLVLLEAAKDKHTEGTAAWEELESERKEVEEAIALLRNTAHSELEYAKLKETEDYANLINNNATSAIDENNKIDVNELLKVDPSTLSQTAQQIHSGLQAAFAEGDGSSGDILSKALKLGEVNSQLQQTGEVGKQSAEQLTAAFLQVNAQGLSKLDGSQLSGLLNSLGMTKQELEAIAKEYEIDLKLPELEFGPGSSSMPFLEPTITPKLDPLGLEKQLKGPYTIDVEGKLSSISASGGGLSTGQNNPNSMFNRTGTMARGSRRGYTIPGRPTLTGEEGEELVWEPKRNEAYMVGSRGPQFANISRDAVVWNAKQTKRIKKNSGNIGTIGLGARGINSFGTMAKGTGLKVGGSASIELVGEIKDVIPPTPPKEIPVKGKLEFNDSGGIKNAVSKYLEAKSTTQTINITFEPVILNKKSLTNVIDGAIPATLAPKSVIQPINITLTPTVSNKEALNNTIPDGKKLKTKTVTQNNTITLNSTVANPKEPKAKIDAAMPKDYKATVKASITISSSINTGNTKKKVQDAVDGESKNTKSSVKVSKSETKVINVSANTGPAAAQISSFVNRFFNKIYTLKYKASGPSKIKVPITADFRGSWTKSVTINKAAQGMNNHIPHQAPLPQIGSVASGSRYGRIGPKGKGGPTLTGEKGFEIAWIPSENRSMILGANGPQMINLPRDAVVWTNEQSKKILSQRAIPAGSHEKSGSGTWTLSSRTSNSSKTTSSKKTSSSSNKTSKQQAKNAKAAEKVIQKGGKIAVFWENQARYVDATQRKIDSSLKLFEKNIKNFRSTFGTIGKTANEYRKYLNRSISLNKASEKQANTELRNLDLYKGASKRSISYEVNKGKNKKETKTESVSLSDYIKYDATYDTYVLDGNALSRLAKTNLNKAKAVKDAAEKEINDKLSKRNTARDNIIKAQEALEKLSDDIYETFGRWEKSINRVYILSQKLESLNKELSINESRNELLFAKLVSGTETVTSDFLSQVTNILNKERENLTNIAIGKNNALIAAESEFRQTMNLGAYANKYLANKSSANAKGDWVAAQKAFAFLRNIRMDNENFNYTSAVNSLNRAGYAKDDYEAIKTILDKIFEAQNNYLDATNEAIEASKAIYDKMEEMQSFISEFETSLLKGIEEQAEEEINRLDKLNIALSKAFKELLDEVKNRLDERRKQEDNIKTETEISQKRQRLAALRADSSGSNAVEIAKLEKEISDAQQNYQRSLEDQLLDRLQKQADAAERQRERQIHLLEVQRDIAKLSDGNLELIRELLQDPERNKGQIRDAWRANNNYDELTPKAQKQLDEQFESEWAKYLGYTAVLGNIGDGTKLINGNVPTTYYGTVEKTLPNIEKSINKIADNLLEITGSISAKTLRSAGVSAKTAKFIGRTAKELREAGYSIKDIGNAGYNKKQLTQAGIRLEDLKNAGVNLSTSRKAGFTAKDAKAAKYTNTQIRKSGYTASQFKSIAPGFKGAKTALAAGYSSSSIAKAYGSDIAMRSLNMSGKTTQAATGASAAYLQSIINKSKNDKAVQTDMAGVKANLYQGGTAKKPTTGAKISGTFTGGGSYIYANKGSDLYIQAWDTKTGKVKGNTTRVPVGKLTASHFNANKKEATEALVSAIQNLKWGSKINSNFLSLVKAAGIIGKEYKLNTSGHNWGASIGSNGIIYQSNGKKGIFTWDPAKGTSGHLNYNRASFETQAKKNKSIGRVYRYVLKNNGVKGYKTGGLADYTGPAWLDGTPSKPELVLNAQDTKNFLALRDVLSHAVGTTNNSSNTYGDTNVEVNINVDNISNDYDVDRLVQRVKKDITKEMGYRNVTQVRNFR